jgi:hypothetical protein
LDGLWIDKLQEILDEANRAYGGKNDWQDQIRSQAPCDFCCDACDACDADG